MRRIWNVPLLMLAGCGGTATEVNQPADDRPATDIAVADTAKPAAAPSTAAPAEAAPDSAQAAADVVRRYHSAIAARRYDDAYRLWDPGAVGMTAEAFAASFAKYADYRADVGTPGRIDAGAGQRYVTVPVRVSGTLTAGGSFALEGPVTLHRVAEIDGATPEQRRWRIRSSDLKPRPGTAPGQPDRVAARYRCIDGNRLVADFDAAAGTVTLRRGGERLGVLRQQPAASGTWYKSGGLELRTKGDAATFSEPGRPPIACTAIR